MIYDYIVKLTNGGIASFLVLSLVSLFYSGDGLKVELYLEKPVTREIIKLVDHGYEFKVEFYCSIIVNDEKTFRKSGIVCLRKENDKYFIDEKPVEKSLLNEEFGSVKFNFDNTLVDENDKVLVFAKTEIIEDKTFTQSTGLKTSILWDYYVPKFKKRFVYKNNELKELKQ